MLKMEQEMIPFSTMADLASTMELDLRKSDCLQKTVRRGARFIQNLSKQLVSPGQGHISKNMDKASLMDGVKFFSILEDPLSFQKSLQQEIRNFHAIPRPFEEIQQFQIKIQEKVQSWSELRNVIYQKRWYIHHLRHFETDMFSLLEFTLGIQKE